MQTYIVLLRGINVSGQKKIKMADLREILQTKGFSDVKTYIQSGNLVLRSSASEKAVSKRVGTCVLEEYGFEVSVVTFNLKNWNRILYGNPFKGDEWEAKGIYFVLLSSSPDPKLVSALEKERYPHEDFRITQKCIYLYCKQGYGRAKCNNNFFEKRLQVRATTRNLRTMVKLRDIAANMG